MIAAEWVRKSLEAEPNYNDTVKIIYDMKDTDLKIRISNFIFNRVSKMEGREMWISAGMDSFQGWILKKDAQPTFLMSFPSYLSLLEGMKVKWDEVALDKIMIKMKKNFNTAKDKKIVKDKILGLKNLFYEKLRKPLFLWDMDKDGL